MHLLIVSARFYDDYASGLERGAQEALQTAGATWDMVAVPGSLEIPAVIRFALDTKKYDGFVALGCVIRGETAHSDIVWNESARGLMQLALDHKVCIGNGIVVGENEAHVRVRVDPRGHNRGGAAAQAALALIALKKQFA